jgi:membrane protein YqaA with SNARE-associated domain
MEYGPLERLKFPIRDFILRHARGPHATWFLSVMSAVESIFSPVPLEVVLGPLVVARPSRWLYFGCVATLWSVIGALVGYWIGYALYDAVGAGIVSWYGLTDNVYEAARLLEEHMFSATLISAFTPIPYKVFVLTAGVLKGQLVVFIAASIIGRGARFLLFAYLVHRFGAALAQLVFRYFTVATIAAVLVAIMGGVFLYF